MAEATDDSKLVDMDDLDAFSSEFFGTKVESFRPETDELPDEKPEDDEAEEVNETGDDAPATDEEPNSEDGDENPDDEEVDEPEDQPKGKKNRNSFQERINELVADKRQTQRELEALRREFEKLSRPVQPEPENVLKQLPSDAPKPDAVDAKGDPLYPLGEFDPKFITEFTRFSVTQEFKAAEAKAEQERKTREIQSAQDNLRRSYAEKVEKVKDDLPDYEENIGNLTETFSGIEPQLGDYLASTIMQCDNGPEIMYYLSQNIGEAQKIVASGPFAATLAIGRLQAKLEKPATPTEVKSNTKKVSEAPKPPENRSRGSRGQFTISPDTDDLDAFEKEFFRKR